MSLYTEHLFLNRGIPCWMSFTKAYPTSHPRGIATPINAFWQFSSKSQLIMEKTKGNKVSVTTMYHCFYLGRWHGGLKDSQITLRWVYTNFKLYLSVLFYVITVDFWALLLSLLKNSTYIYNDGQFSKEVCEGYGD